MIDRGTQAAGVDTVHIAHDQAAAIQFGHDAEDAAGAVHVFHMHIGNGRRHLADAGHATGKPVDVLHREVHPGFMRGGEQMQHGVGGPAHGDIQRHRVLERLEGGDVARQDRGIILFIVALCQTNDGAAGFQEQFAAVGMGGDDGAVAGQAKAERLYQAVH